MRAHLPNNEHENASDEDQEVSPANMLDSQWRDLNEHDDNNVKVAYPQDTPAALIQMGMISDEH